MKYFIFLLFLNFILIQKIYSQNFDDLKIYTENNPPYVKVDDKNQISGHVGNKVLKILKKTNISPNRIEILPWARALLDAKKRKNVMIFPFVKTKERNGIFNFAILAYKQSLNFYKLKTSKDIQVKNLEDAKKYSTCVVRNDYKHEHLLSEKFTNFEETTHQNVNVQKFLNHRCDLIISAEEGLVAKLKEFNTDINTVEKVLEVKNFDANIYIAFSPGTDQDIIDAFINADK
jgi:polar amino acid transport system substrate-binding protein